MKKYILLAVTLLTSMTMWAVDYVVYDGVRYEITTGTNVVLNHDGTSNGSSIKEGDVVIPASFTDESTSTTYNVVGFKCWYNGYESNEVNLNLAAIPATSIKLSGDYDQSLRSYVGTLTLPSGVTSIDITNGTGYYSPQYVESFVIAAENTAYSTVDGVLFSKDGKKLIAYPHRKPTVIYTIPDGVTTIGQYAFYNADDLETVVIPEGVTKIEQYAFADCNNIYECILPSSLTDIGQNAFHYCNHLAKTGLDKIPGLLTIGTEAFYGCDLVFDNNLFVLPGTLKSIGVSAFNNDAFKNPTTVELPKTLGASGTQMTIGDYAFTCNILRSYMTDPRNVNTWAFSNVSSIYIPKGTLDTYKAKNGWGAYPDKLKESTSTTVDPSLPTVAKPTIKEALDEVNSIVNVTMATETEGATIRYKVFYGSDDSDPVDWAVYNEYGESPAPAIDVDPNGQSIKIIALKDGYNASELFEKTYDFASMRCKTPTINCVYKSTSMSISNATEDATIVVNKYSKDATTGAYSVLVSTDTYSGPITLDGNFRYEAVAQKSGMFTSGIAEYTVTWFKCEKPTIVYSAEKPDGSNVVVKIIPPASGGTCMYRVDGTASFLDFINPFTVKQNTGVYAITRKDNYDDSDQEYNDLYRSNITSQTPTIGIDETTKKLTITAEDGFDVYYTLDPKMNGITPTVSAELKYPAEGITLTGNTKVVAIAHKDGWFQSSEASTTISNWFTCPDVVMTQVIENGALKMKLGLADSTSVDVTGMKIRYRVNDRDYYNPENMAEYTEPIIANNGDRIWCVAMKEGYNNSNWNNAYMDFSSYTQCQTPYIDAPSDTKLVTISSSEEGVDLYYVIQEYGADEVYPTTASTKYTEPFSPETNCYIKAIAAKEGCVNSNVTSISLSDWFRLPHVIFEPEYGDDNSYTVRLSHENENVEIWYYTSNNGTQKKYDGNPVPVSLGEYISAQARLEGQESSYWSEYYINDENFTVRQPMISTNSETKKLTVTTSTPNASIYYTSDGTDPTSASTKLESEELTLTQNGTYKFIGIKDKMNNSSVSSVEITDWFRVSDVTITPFVEDNRLKVKITCEDEDAQIYYGINDYNSIVTSNLPYTAPIVISDGDRIYASAAKANFSSARWASTSWLYSSNYMVSQPTISISADTLVNIAHEDGSTVYYTLDGTDPTTSSTKYSSAFKLKGNCTIKAFAVMSGKINSSIYTTDYNRFYVGELTSSLEEAKMTITCATPGVTILYAYEAEPRDENNNVVYTHTYNGTFELQYNGSLFVKAEKENYNPNNTSFWIDNVVKCPKVELESFNGHSMKLKSISGSTVWYTTNGSYPYDNTNGWYDYVFEYKDSIEIKGLGTIRAMATSPYRNQSDVAEFEVTSYAGINGATSDKAGNLATSMGWANPSAITEFTVTGPINADDMSFIKTKMTSLQHLDLSEATVDDGKIPDKAFADMPLLEFSSPNGLQAVGDNIFSGCDNLAAVVWNTTAKIPDNAFDADVNPNLLLFVPSEDAAPTNSYAQNIIVNGTAKNIILSDGEGNNFHCPQGFYAQNITYTHNFKLESGDGYGWETIALPFECSRFIHESKGELLPFAAYDSLTEKGMYKPFWLRELTDIEFKDVSKIEPNKPYIICMPNSDSYATRYRVGGKVTFSATDTWVPVTEPQSVQKGVNTLYANFLNSENTDDIMLLNTEETDGKKAGSIFKKRSGRALRPFEAYVISRANARDYVSVTRGFSDDPDADDDTTPIETISTQSSGKMVKVYSLSGVLVKEAAEEDALKGLAKGVYIVNGKSMIVK